MHLIKQSTIQLPLFNENQGSDLVTEYAFVINTWQRSILLNAGKCITYYTAHVHVHTIYKNMFYSLSKVQVMRTECNEMFRIYYTVFK